MLCLPISHTMQSKSLPKSSITFVVKRAVANGNDELAQDKGDQFNMDQFRTRMTEKGVIISAETKTSKSMYRNFATGANNSTSKTGLLLDIKLGKNVNIFDYVHSNDQTHIIQHIQNGKCSFICSY